MKVIHNNRGDWNTDQYEKAYQNLQHIDEFIREFPHIMPKCPTPPQLDTIHQDNDLVAYYVARYDDIGIEAYVIIDRKTNEVFVGSFEIPYVYDGSAKLIWPVSSMSPDERFASAGAYSDLCDDIEGYSNDPSVIARYPGSMHSDSSCFQKFINTIKLITKEMK